MYVARPYLYVTPLDERINTLCLFFLSTAPLLPSVSLSALEALLDNDLYTAAISSAGRWNAEALVFLAGPLLLLDNSSRCKGTRQKKVQRTARSHSLISLIYHPHAVLIVISRRRSASGLCPCSSLRHETEHPAKSPHGLWKCSKC